MDEQIEFRSNLLPAGTDRRRPGLPEFNVSAMPRRPKSPAPTQVAEPGEPEETSVVPGRSTRLSAARGICMGVAMGTLIWVCIGVGLWQFVLR